MKEKQVIKKILYVDMDGVIADFDKLILEYDPSIISLSSHLPNYAERSVKVEKVMRDNPRLFLDLEPIEGSIESVKRLWSHFDVLFLSTPCPFMIDSFSDKMTWIYKYFGKDAENRLILSQRKELSIGHYLVDDRTANGAELFTGEHLHFGTKSFPTWVEVEEYLINKK
jgi:5'-nucleotidase